MTDKSQDKSTARPNFLFEALNRKVIARVDEFAAKRGVRNRLVPEASEVDDAA